VRILGGWNSSTAAGKALMAEDQTLVAANPEMHPRPRLMVADLSEVLQC